MLYHNYILVSTDAVTSFIVNAKALTAAPVILNKDVLLASITMKSPLVALLVGVMFNSFHLFLEQSVQYNLLSFLVVAFVFMHH